MADLNRPGFNPGAVQSVSAGWTCEAGHHVHNMRCQVGWQPSRFLTDRAEAERAFALAERLGSVNAAALEDA
jgi:hypothetical protein